MKTTTYLFSILITFLIFSFYTNNSFGQQGGLEGHGNANAYEMAAGLRAGFGFGGTYKMAFGDSKANYAEGIVNHYRKSVREDSVTVRKATLALKALYQYAFDTKFDGFRWYVGAGPSLAIGLEAHLGLSAMAGVEFNFADFPFNVSLDYMPTFKLLRKQGDDGVFDAEFGGLSIRYIIR